MSQKLTYIDWAEVWELWGANGLDYYLSRGWTGYTGPTSPPWAKKGCLYTKSAWAAAYESYCADEAAEARFAELTAWSRDYTAPESSPPVPPGHRPLFPFQKRAAIELAARRKMILADKMGLGKTKSAIAGANQLGRFVLEKILVLCPASLRINWAREIEETQTLDLPVEMWEKYSQNSEGKVVGADSAWVICNYDRTLKARDELMAIDWDLVICDEAHRLKNTSAKRAIIALGDEHEEGLADISPHLFLLTGTPVKNTVEDLWPLLRAVDPETWTWSRFSQDHLGYLGRKKPRGARPKNLAQLELRWRLGAMMRRTESPDLVLPPIFRHAIHVEGEKALPAELEELAGGEVQAAKDNVEAVLGGADPSDLEPGRLRISFENNFRFATRRMKSGLKKVAPTVDRALALIEEGEKVVIFAHHRDVVKGIVEGLGDLAVSIGGGMTAQQRQDSIDAFQKGTAQACVCQIIAAGEGVTLTAARYLLIAEMDWTVAQNEQAEARIHRIGQTAETVFIEYILANDGVDGRILRACRRKAALVKAVVDSTTMRVAVSESRRQETLTELGNIEGAYEAALKSELEKITTWTRALESLAWAAIEAAREDL